MPAKKPAPTSGKATKPAARSRVAPTPSKAKPAAKPVAKAAAKPAVAIASKAAKRPSDPDTEIQPAVTSQSPKKPRPVQMSPADSVVVPPSADDGDPNEHALLSGPRNVQPYVVKRGEEYMNKEQLNHFRQILSIWKRDLMVEVDRTVSHMKDEAANFPDPNDRATQEEEFSLELRTRDRERKLIRKIDEAIKRIEDGSYGYCLETGEQIGLKRLEARPVATLCLEAQERRERREKQYGDRDDHYR